MPDLESAHHFTYFRTPFVSILTFWFFSLLCIFKKLQRACATPKYFLIFIKFYIWGFLIKSHKMRGDPVNISNFRFFWNTLIYICRGSRGKPGQWGSPATPFLTRLCMQLVFMVVVSVRQYTGWTGNRWVADKLSYLATYGVKTFFVLLRIKIIGSSLWSRHKIDIRNITGIQYSDVHDRRG